MRRLSIRPSWIAGVAGLLAVAFSGVVSGQVRAPGVGPAAGANALAVGPDTQMLINHAISMAISGSTLNFAAKSAKMGERSEARHEHAAKTHEGGHGDQIEHQVRQQAERDFNGSSELFRTAYNMVRSEAAGTPTQRLYTAAVNYTNTLRTLCGQPTRESASQTRERGAAEAAGSQVARTRNNNQRGQEAGRGQSRSAAYREPNAAHLSPDDEAAVALINEAVSEAIAAVDLEQMPRPAPGPAAASDVAAQRLQEHARQMAANSQQLVRRIEGVWNAGNQPERNAAERAGRGQGQHAGPASAQTLARQARDLIQALQQASPVPAGGPGGAPVRIIRPARP